MEYNTSALCDIYLEQVDVVEPMFSNFGGRASFAGQITTIKCFEDNSLIRETLEQDGLGRVLLIDGGGSLRKALVDAEIAAIAEENEWEGIVVYGCVREVDELEDMNLGIQALASIPVGAASQSIGEFDIPVNFGGVSFLPEDYIYADSTGIILSPEPLNIDLELDEEVEEEELEEQDPRLLALFPRTKYTNTRLSRVFSILDRKSGITPLLPFCQAVHECALATARALAELAELFAQALHVESEDRLLLLLIFLYHLSALQLPFEEE